MTNARDVAAYSHSLPANERAGVLALCNSDRFCNSAPGGIVATLFDDGQYVVSGSTFYWIGVGW